MNSVDLFLEAVRTLVIKLPSTPAQQALATETAVEGWCSNVENEYQLQAFSDKL